MTMALTWRIVDKWRVEKRLSKAEFARKVGIPENTIYRGLRENSDLRPTTRTVIRSLFPEKFNDRGEVVDQ